jgi:N-ethylmaleimide reductase
VASGRPIIANPHRGARLPHGKALAVAPHEAYYGGGAQGYTDWPALA